MKAWVIGIKLQMVREGHKNDKVVFIKVLNCMYTCVPDKRSIAFFTVLLKHC